MKKPLIKLILFSLAGALLGYGYYYFIGCRTGSCPLTSNPLISTLYGSVLGFVMGFDTKIFQKKLSRREE
ncbi:MAG: hypothetical protein JXL67_09945 [Calditrichaeota bacterium]|nr:hypothetical protein [Calditrichota bacterium]